MKTSGRPRIANVRGPNLNPWEMQNQPLAESFDLTGSSWSTPSTRTS
jgi:hypothetical protein